MPDCKASPNLSRAICKEKITNSWHPRGWRHKVWHLNLEYQTFTSGNASSTGSIATTLGCTTAVLSNYVSELWPNEMVTSGSWRHLSINGDKIVALPSPSDRPELTDWHSNWYVELGVEQMKLKTNSHLSNFLACPGVRTWGGKLLIKRAGRLFLGGISRLNRIQEHTNRT